MLVQGLVAGKDVDGELEPSRSPAQRATALALVFSELFQNALEHGGEHVVDRARAANGDVVLAIADDGAGSTATATAPASRSCARSSATSFVASSRSRTYGGLRAEVVFPA
jgi:two-component sensor histidine kinase